MKLRGLAVCTLASTIVASCGQHALDPRPQLIVAIDTDAPVPRMGDRLRLTILDASLAPLCDTCTRTVELDGATTWPLTFGVPVPANGTRLHLRATVFSAARTSGGDPLAPTAIDRIVRLDPAGPISHLRVMLPVDCAGAPPSLSDHASCIDGSQRVAPIASAPIDHGAPSLVGTWHADLQRGCVTSPRADSGLFDEQVCVKGGVFWMGDARVQGFGPADDGVPEHAVAVSPFLIDRYEWTVGRFRAALAGGLPRSTAPQARGVASFQTVLGGAAAPDCNFYGEKRDDPARDALPLNCVNAFVAAQICAFAGGALPTEAQWEWAAGGREAERLYPWGDEPWPCLATKCGDDLYQMSNYGQPPGTRAIDSTVDGVMDMALNVTEWVADDFVPYVGACWMPGAYSVDPVGRRGASDLEAGLSIRGGSYGVPNPTGAVVPYRVGFPRTSVQWSMGVRCVYADGG